MASVLKPEATKGDASPEDTSMSTLAQVSVNAAAGGQRKSYCLYYIVLIIIISNAGAHNVSGFQHVIRPNIPQAILEKLSQVASMQRANEQCSYISERVILDNGEIKPTYTFEEESVPPYSISLLLRVYVLARACSVRVYFAHTQLPIGSIH